jgi:(1->4)-alpha-D-glucan 1-alpha-D-glucosylmutase
MFVTQRALALRARIPEAFGPASAYKALFATGEKNEHVVAFLRGDAVLTVAPRLVVGLRGDWRDTRLELPPGRWRDAFSGADFEGPTSMTQLFTTLPVALLARPDDPDSVTR